MEYSTLSVIGGTVLAIATAIGLGNLLLAMYHRYTGGKDRRASIHESNRGAELDHDDKFLERVLTRVTALEDTIERMRTEMLDYVRRNAALTQENERQENEIAALLARDEERLTRIRHLETQVAELTEAVELLNKRSLLNAAELKVLTECSDNIQESINRLGFVPTGDPTDEDNAAVQRLKEIREASKKIAQVVAG
jgi:chromosome segregation ATPase